MNRFRARVRSKDIDRLSITGLPTIAVLELLLVLEREVGRIRVSMLDIENLVYYGDAMSLNGAIVTIINHVPHAAHEPWHMGAL